MKKYNILAKLQRNNESLTECATTGENHEKKVNMWCIWLKVWLILFYTSGYKFTNIVFGQTVCTQCIVFSDIFMQCNERVWCLEMFTVTTISLLIGWSLVKYMKVSADKTKPKHMSEGFQHHSRGRVKKKNNYCSKRFGETEAYKPFF